MNEELQSTNEELEAMNDEMRERTDEALHANAFLSSILSSVHQSIVVVDQDLRIVAWSRAAAETWGLRADEVRGEHLLNLDIGIPADQLRDPIRDGPRRRAAGRRRRARTQPPRPGGRVHDLVRSAHRTARRRAGRDPRDGRRARRAGLGRRLGRVVRMRLREPLAPARARATPSRGAPRCARADRRRAIAAAAPSRW